MQAEPHTSTCPGIQRTVSQNTVIRWRESTIATVINTATSFARAQGCYIWFCSAWISTFAPSRALSGPIPMANPVFRFGVAFHLQRGWNLSAEIVQALQCTCLPTCTRLTAVDQGELQTLRCFEGKRHSQTTQTVQGVHAVLHACKP